MERDFIREYLRLKDEAERYQCTKAIQSVTLFVGMIVFFIHQESFLIAILAYFWLEISLIKSRPISEMQHFIQSQINNDAKLITEHAILRNQ